MRLAGQPASIDTRPLTPELRGTLGLHGTDALGRGFVSSASGIAAVHGRAWVVSDELGDLARYTSLSRAGDLRVGLAARAKKPDLESVTWLPRADGSGLLFAAGSGSGPDRHRGVVARIDSAGHRVGDPREVDLAPLHAALAAKLPHGLNIEGMATRQAADGAELLLFHRGRLDGEHNTIFRLALAPVLDALEQGRALPADALRGATTVDLGSMDGARLGFADARALPDGRIAFIASSEGFDTDPDDGTIHGSVVGTLNDNLQLQSLRPLTGTARKAEGIERAELLDPAAAPGTFVLVTDPDDPAAAAEVLSVDLR